MKKVSFVIGVRDREQERIKRCVNSLKSPITKEIIIVDYGSKKPVKQIKGTDIIRVNTDNIWNKSHALNIGIKAAKGKYIATIDCDIILTKNFFKEINKLLKKDTFIISLDVRRIDLIGLRGNIPERYIKYFSKPWAEINRKIIYQNHNANGGIQLFSKEWIEKVRGYDENLIYWGGIDNDLYERALMDKLIIINLNKTIYHQEHEKKKELILDDPNERIKASEIRMNKIEYLENKMKNNEIVGNKIWGIIDDPQQSYFLGGMEEIRKGKENLIKEIKKAIKNKKDTTTVDGQELKIFYPEKN